MTDDDAKGGLSRRGLIAAGLLMPTGVLAAPPASRKLSFAVFRNGAQVGEQHMSFAGDATAPTVTTDVQLLVKLGPVPVYRYRHHAVERWAAGRFASLETSTNGNGKLQKVSARRGEGGVVIEAGRNRISAPANAAPFSHWNPDAFAGPMFNPQEGGLLKVTAARKGAGSVKLANGRQIQASQWSVRGEAQIDDWYDEAGVWAALSGKLKDGSMMEYRRV